MHADGDGAVREGLNAIDAMRKTHYSDDVRPPLRTMKSSDPGDYPRYAELGALPVLSFQWEKPDGDNTNTRYAIWARCAPRCANRRACSNSTALEWSSAATGRWTGWMSGWPCR